MPIEDVATVDVDFDDLSEEVTVNITLVGSATPDMLTTLNTDLLLRIASFLSPADLIHSTQQCRKLHKVMRSPQLWHPHLTTLYGNYTCSHNNHDPYDLYIQRGKSMLSIFNTNIGDAYMCTTCACTMAFVDVETLQQHQVQHHTEEWYSRCTLKDERITMLKIGIITKKPSSTSASRPATPTAAIEAAPSQPPLSPTLKPSAIGRSDDPTHRYQCLHCKFKTARKERLYLHMELYHTQQCDLCDFQCLLHSQLVQHVKEQHTVEELQAVIQQAKSTDSPVPVKQLNRVTYRALNQAVVHPCPHCSFATDKKSNLWRHLRKQHTALLPPPMEPDTEMMSDASKENEQQAEESAPVEPATSLELYVCEAYPACSLPNKTFYNANSFRLHMLKHHSTTNTFTCTQYQCCLYKNNTLNGLLSHIQYHHNKKNQEMNARLPYMKVRAQRMVS